MTQAKAGRKKPNGLIVGGNSVQYSAIAGFVVDDSHPKISAHLKSGGVLTLFFEDRISCQSVVERLNKRLCNEEMTTNACTHCRHSNENGQAKSRSQNGKSDNPCNDCRFEKNRPNFRAASSAMQEAICHREKTYTNLLKGKLA